MTTRFNTDQMLADRKTNAYTVNITGDTYTLTFENVEQALKAIETAKRIAFMEYVNGGGNPRNKRGFGAQFAQVKKAVVEAAA